MLNISPIFNSTILNLFLRKIPILASYKKTLKVSEYPKINIFITFIVSKSEINSIINSPEFQEYKTYSEDRCKFIFVDLDLNFTQWLNFYNKDEIATYIIDCHGNRLYLSGENSFVIEKEIKNAIIHSLVPYKITKEIYNELKNLATQLQKERFDRIGYNPLFYMDIKKISSITCFIIVYLITYLIF
jgi:hypothetical protein